MNTDSQFMHSIWQHDDALATDGDTSNASSAHTFTLNVIGMIGRGWPECANLDVGVLFSPAFIYQLRKDHTVVWQL